VNKGLLRKEIIFKKIGFDRLKIDQCLIKK